MKKILIGISIFIVVVMVGFVGYLVVNKKIIIQTPQNSTQIIPSTANQQNQKSSVITIDPKNPSISNYTSYVLGVTFQYKNTVDIQLPIGACPPPGTNCKMQTIQTPLPAPKEDGNNIIFDGGDKIFATLFIQVINLDAGLSIPQAIQKLPEYNSANCQIKSSSDKYGEHFRIISNPGLPDIYEEQGNDEGYCGYYSDGVFVPLAGSSNKMLFVSGTQYVPDTVAPDGSPVFTTFHSL